MTNQALSEANLSVLNRFNAAFNRHDTDEMMTMLTLDSTFENTYPPPDGERHSGWASVGDYWREFFRTSPGAHLDFEEIQVFEDRGFQRWVYSWQDESGGHGHIRGVDLFRFRDGKISEKLSYVKG